MKILIIEENRDLAEKIGQAITRKAGEGEIAADGETGERYAEGQDYDLIIADEDLPDKSGFQMIKNIREKGIRTPICMLTAAEMSDRVKALNLGADYSLSKPVEWVELQAVAFSLIRRENGGCNDLSYGNTVLDTAACCLKCDGKKESLTATEFEIMRLLLHSGENILSKEMILENVWGLESNATENYVEVYVAFLRKKLRGMQSNVNIQCVRRLGYKLGLKAN